jgi:hypothetical protein
MDTYDTHCIYSAPSVPLPLPVQGQPEQPATPVLPVSPLLALLWQLELHLRRFMPSKYGDSGATSWLLISINMTCFIICPKFSKIL